MIMLNIQIEDKLKNIENFLGVFACDNLPRPHEIPYSLIANTDKEEDPGEHWIAIYVNSDGQADYFDSYGLPPLKKEFLEFLDEYTKGFSYNKITLQCTSCVTCGEYASAYIYLRSSGYSHDEYMRYFTKNTTSNDLIIKNLFSSLRQ